MASKVIVIGTDTEIGKTSVCRLILAEAKHHGLSALGIKPLSAGGLVHSEGGYNEDALYLRRASSWQMGMNFINPIRYSTPVSPNIAAQIEGDPELCVDRIFAAIEPSLALPIDLLVIEGIGGWMVPLNTRQTFADLVIKLDLPVVLVVGLKLGCLNHALLTYQALKASRVRCLGWVANQITGEMLAYRENLSTLRSMLPIPYLAEVPYQPDGLRRYNDFGLRDALY